MIFLYTDGEEHLTVPIDSKWCSLVFTRLLSTVLFADLFLATIYWAHKTLLDEAITT